MPTTEIIPEGKGFRANVLDENGAVVVTAKFRNRDRAAAWLNAVS